MDRTDSGGHRVEEERQGAVESEGASNNEKGLEQGHGARQGVRQSLRRASDMGEGGVGGCSLLRLVTLTTHY